MWKVFGYATLHQNDPIRSDHFFRFDERVWIELDLITSAFLRFVPDFLSTFAGLGTTGSFFTFEDFSVSSSDPSGM